MKKVLVELMFSYSIPVEVDDAQHSQLYGILDDKDESGAGTLLARTLIENAADQLLDNGTTIVAGEYRVGAIFDADTDDILFEDDEGKVI